jgi:hypothetical protein
MGDPRLPQILIPLAASIAFGFTVATLVPSSWYPPSTDDFNLLGKLHDEIDEETPVVPSTDRVMASATVSA